MMNTNKVNVLWIATVFIYGLFHAFVLSESVGRPAIEDKGIISTLNIIVVAGAIFITLNYAKSLATPNLKLPVYALVYVMFIYLLREADFHRIFTEEHVTRLKFYTDESTDLLPKLVAGIPLILFLICFFYSIIRFYRTLLEALRERQVWSISFVLWGVTIFLSQIVDKTFLNEIYRGRVLEELLEFTAAGYMFITAWILTRQK